MIITQSLIKQILHKGNLIDYCAKKIYHRYILNEKIEITTEAQLKGIYFESHTLGYDHFELPTKKNGEPYIDTLRINRQIKNFRDIMVEKLMFVHPSLNTQIRLRKKWNEHIIEGTLDWFPTFYFHEGDLKLAIIDLKLTKNINNDFGDFCWGDVTRIDWLQGAMYHELVHDIDWEMNAHLTQQQVRLIQKFDNILKAEEEMFLFMVFDYKDPLEHKFIEVGWDYDKKKYLENSIEKAVHELEYMEATGWQPSPTTENCKRCLLDCPARLKLDKI